MARKPSDTVQLNLRFSEGLRRRLERAASVNKESMNTEIVERLEETFKRDEENKALREALQNTQSALDTTRQLHFDSLKELAVELRELRQNLETPYERATRKFYEQKGKVPMGLLGDPQIEREFMEFWKKQIEAMQPITDKEDESK
jgi:hypothetical protein